jgi:hypothetical protein
MTRIRVEVTQNDIDKSCRNNSSNCPIQRAIRRLVRDEFLVTVRSTELIIQHGIGKHISISVELPEQAIDFIQDFDQYYSVKPFTFYLNLFENELQYFKEEALA